MSADMNMPVISPGHADLTDQCSGPFRILVAEDDQEMRTMLAEALRRGGNTVIECSDGWDLIRNLGALYLPEDRDPVDLVVSDIRLPGISGLEILTALHTFEPLPPLVFITAFGDDDTHELANTLGAIETIDKPFEMKFFLERIHGILCGHRRAARGDRGPAQPVPGARPEEDPLLKKVLENFKKVQSHG